MEIKTTEFFKNFKTLPPQDSQEFWDLIDWEKDKCLGGVSVQGIKISGWLYWHLNHWHIGYDTKDNYGNDIVIPQLPDLRDNEWERAEAIEECQRLKQGYIEVGQRRGGKALKNSSILYKENSTITIGEVQTGDYIYDDSGNLTKVLEVFPQGKRPVYEMILEDGRKLYPDENHVWRVFCRTSNSYKNLTTKELLKKGINKTRVHNGYKDNLTHIITESKFAIPNIQQPIPFKEKNLKIDPYWLGMWLGDGNSRSTFITTIDDEIKNSIYDYAERLNMKVSIDKQKGKSAVSYMITNGIGKKNYLLTSLKEYNLLKNKHIPREYLFSSPEQRLELLKGLMDTDGSCYKTGRITFSSSNPTLAKDFEFLVRSLGIQTRYRIKPSGYIKKGGYIKCKDSYEFTLYTNQNIFKLSRKSVLINKDIQKRNQDKTFIKSLKYIGEDNTTCIIVDNKSHLFLTDNFTITHNSEALASYLGYNSNLFENTQNAIITGNSNDQATLIQKYDFGHQRLWEGIKINKLDRDWRKSSIRLGYKDSSNEDHVWSLIAIRNAADGVNTEVAAGLTLKTFILDEIGKFMFGQVMAAAKPTLLTQNGWRGIPLLCGTGGAFEKGEDAERYFNNPRANKFLGFPNENSTKETGKFFSGLYRMDCKYDSNLADYLEKEQKMTLDPKQKKELSKIPMKVSDKEKALKIIKEDRELKKLDPDRTEYLKEIMYFPLTPEECFMTEGANIFNEIIIRQQQEFLYTSQKYLGDRCILRETPMGIDCEIVTDDSIAPVSSYPVKSNESNRGCIVIYEHPPKGEIPYGLYVGGVDPYKQDKAMSSVSLGAVYIFKRTHDIVSESYQDMIVAQYVGRPDSIDEWCENARLLIKYYNALTLVENEDIYFIKYMQAKFEDHYLADEQPYIKAMYPTSSVERGKGFHAAPKNIALLNTHLKEYIEEVISQERNEEGEVTRKIFGVSKVLDPLLLEEMKKFRLGKDAGNYDRVRAASAAVSLARHLDPYYLVQDTDISNSKTMSYRERRKRRQNKGAFPTLISKSSLLRHNKR